MSKIHVFSFLLGFVEAKASIDVWAIGVEWKEFGRKRGGGEEVAEIGSGSARSYES